MDLPRFHKALILGSSVSASVVLLGLCASPSQSFEGEVNDDGSIELHNSLRSLGSEPLPGGGSSPSRPIRETLSLPDCPINNPSTGIVETCSTALLGCPAGSVKMRVWTAPAGTKPGSPGWTAGSPYCSSDPTAAPTPTMTLEEFRRLPLPAGSAYVQPPGDYVLIRMPTNVYAGGTTPVELSTTLLGQPVKVRATPTAWTWTFGDGTTMGPSQDPGGPYPILTHVHEYTAPGTYAITMTTHYTGEYSVDNGPWQAISGQAHVSSPPATVIVRTAHAQLRAN